MIIDVKKFFLILYIANPKVIQQLSGCLVQGTHTHIHTHTHTHTQFYAPNPFYPNVLSPEFNYRFKKWSWLTAVNSRI